MSKHLLDIASLGDDEIVRLLDRAAELATELPPRLDHLTIANLFYEPSTRTRVSFELAARGLGATLVNIAADQASVTKGETLADTARTLAALGVNVIVLRHPEAGAPIELAAELPEQLRLVNGGDGARAHPTQALLDALTLRQAGVDVASARIAIVGDIRHSRVACSDIELFTRLGARDIRIAGPAPLMPDEKTLKHTTRCASLSDAIDGADVIIMLRIQAERMESAGENAGALCPEGKKPWSGAVARAGAPDPPRYHAEWGLKPEHLKLAAPDCRILHPGPMNRGIEIASEVADGPQSLIWQQVAMGLPVRMAVFEWLASQ